MKRLFALAFLSALLAGCATAPPDPNMPDPNAPVAAQDDTGVPIAQPRRALRPSVGIGLGTWGGHGFGGLGIGLGF